MNTTQLNELIQTVSNAATDARLSSGFNSPMYKPNEAERDYVRATERTSELVNQLVLDYRAALLQLAVQWVGTGLELFTGIEASEIRTEAIKSSGLAATQTEWNALGCSEGIEALVKAIEAFKEGRQA